jgi:hypothetical protein
MPAAAAHVKTLDTCTPGRQMRHFVSAMLVIAGVIHLLPLPGIMGAERLAQLYGVSLSEPNVALFMQHRAVLFGLLGLFLILAAFRPALQRLAFAAGFASVVSIQMGESMTSPAKTIFVFGLYLLGLGVVLVLEPNLLLSVFRIPVTSEVWIRVIGVLVLEFGVCYVVAAQKNWEGFIALTVPLRLSVMVFFAAFVLLLNAPPALLLFGAADLAFALWTWNAIRRRGAPNAGSVA